MKRQAPQDAGQGSGVLLVSKFYPPTPGGIENVVAQQARMLRDSGYKVTVLCHSGQRCWRTYSEWREDIRVIRCGCWGQLFSLPLAPALPWWLWRQARCHQLLCPHLPNPLVSLLCLLLPRRLPMAIYWHSDIIKQKRLKQLVQWWQRRLCRRAAAIMTSSANLARHSQVLPEFANKIHIVPLGVDTASPTCLPAPPPELADRQGPFALFLGRLCYYKGLDVLLAALEQLPSEARNFPLVIAGDGPLKHYLQQKLHSGCYPQVQFIERYVSDAEKQWLLKEAAFLLFPSTEASEAFGLVQLEAMRYGVPVINTHLPTGVPSVSLHEQTGLTVPPHDAAALAAAISRLINSPHLRRRLGQQAKSRVQRYYSLQQAQNALYHVYNQVLTKT